MSQPNNLTPLLTTLCFDCGREIPTDWAEGYPEDVAIVKEVQVIYPDDWYGEIEMVKLTRQVCLSCFSQNGHCERHNTDFGKLSNSLSP